MSRARHPAHRPTSAAASGHIPTLHLGRAAAAIVKQGLRWLAHTGVVVGSAGASTVVTASVLMGESPRPSLALVGFAVTLSSYGIDRAVDRARDGHTLRSATLERVRGLPVVWLVLFALAVVLAVREAGLAAGAILLGMPLTVVLYVMPWLGRRAPPRARPAIRRVKDIPLAKAFYVAACWVLFVPLAALFAGRPLDLRLLPAAACVFCFLFVNVVACDLRDLAADRAAGVITFPVLLGPARTVRALRAVNGLYALAVLLGLGLGALPGAGWGLALQAWLVDRCLVRVGTAGADVPFYCDVCFDGVIAVLPLLFVVGACAGKLL